ncbi:MAG: histidinol-phosphatase HisJ family protein [Coriobacteriales bacterium]|nr:histidinol-phosphatase HisJ family protein [Coriobacteriales bacterium]
MLADYHVHCMFSDDSWYIPEKVVEDAWKNNLEEICFTDHVDYGVKPDWEEALSAKVMEGQRVVNVDYAAYFPCIADLRERWADRIRVKAGLEFGVQTHTVGQFSALWERWANELDFVLLSIHQVGDLEFWTGEFQQGRSQEIYNRAYYQELYDVATSFAHWSVLAHVDLIKRYDPAGILDFPANRDLVAATLEHTIAQGKGIELNTSSVRYGLTDSQPAREILELYRDLGGTIITLGSDSHAPEHLGAYIRHFQHYLASLGFEGFCTYDKMVPTFHRWDFA